MSVRTLNKAPKKVSSIDFVDGTGRELSQWFLEMEARGFQHFTPRKMKEKLVNDYAQTEEWAKTISHEFIRTFELQARKGLTQDFEVSISKTFHYPVNEVFDRAIDWFETEKRTEMQRHISQKRLNCKWLSDNSQVAVSFHKKGKDKTQMIVQHEQLESETDADVMRNFWKQHLPQIVESL